MLIDVDSKLVKMSISIVNFKNRSIPVNVVPYSKIISVRLNRE